MEEKKAKSRCNDFTLCMEYLYLMLDNEATADQELFVANHIDKCITCFEQYEVEKEIRDLIKTKIEKRPVPDDLANEIRIKIQSAI